MPLSHLCVSMRRYGCRTADNRGLNRIIVKAVYFAWLRETVYEPV